MLSPTLNLTSNFETHRNVGDYFYFVYIYIYVFSIFPQSMKKFNGHFSGPSMKLTFRPKKRKVTFLLWFWKIWPPPPTWHQILKPIRMSLIIFILCISRYILYLYSHKAWRKLKNTFDYRHFRPHQTLASRSPGLRPLRKALDAGPRRDIVGA